jgi:salicylate 5-hydroxylase small subunit
MSSSSVHPEQRVELAEDRVSKGLVTPELFFAVQALHAEVARVLDQGEFAAWPEFFIDNCVYRVQSRENHERGLSLAAIRLESKAMLVDRVVGATDTIFHHPYRQRHLIGPPVISNVGAGSLDAEAPFLVMRTHLDALPQVLAVGRYLDRLVRPPGGGWKFSQRLCIFDNDLLPNSLIYPI